MVGSRFRYSQAVRRRTLDPLCEGSNPSTGCHFRLVVRTLPLHGSNTGSIPVSGILSFMFLVYVCFVVWCKGNMSVLGAEDCGFEPHHPE